MIAFQEVYQDHISTSSRQPLSMPDQKLQDFSNPSLLLRMSSSQKRQHKQRTPRSDALGIGCHIQVMEVVACTNQARQSNCNKYGIFFVPSLCRGICISRLESGSYFRTTVLTEDVSSDGAVQSIKHEVSWGGFVQTT
jgi:hypothetical protein